MNAPALTWSNDKQLKGLNQKHLELMELMIHSPELSNKQLADRLGVTEAWCSTFKHSDLFQEEYNRRVAEHRTQVSAGIVRKIEDVTDITLTRMRRILDDDSVEVGLGRLAQVFDITSKRLFPEQRTGTVVNIALADPDAIKKARERADRLRTGSTMIDVTSESISS